MTQTTPERKQCSVCPGEYTVTAAGMIRHHTTDNPEFQADPTPHTSNKCRGAGELPAGAAPATSADGPQCRLCRHPVQITGNGRARSHLTPEATPRPCPGGSDFPLGTYPDMVGTTDGLVATLARDCGHVPAGECYACYGAAGNPISDAELESMTEAQGTGSAPWGVDTDSVAQPTMADQLKSTPFMELLERETQGVGTVLDDGDTRTEAGRFLELAASGGLARSNATFVPRSGGLSEAERERLAVVADGFKDRRTEQQKASDARTSELTREVVKILEQRSPEQKAADAARMDRTASAALGVPLDPALNHNYTDTSGVGWTHPGPEVTCRTPECSTARFERSRPEGFDPNCEQCATDTHRCPGCGTDVRHGTVACADCTARAAAEDAERQAKCTHPDGFQAPLRIDGRDVPACEHCNAVEWFQYVGTDENGTPCTHPDGFQDTADDVDEDGQDRVVSVCAICGVMDPEDELPDDEETHVVTDASDDPEHAWRTPADTVRDLMPEDVQGLDALRLNCRGCGHPVTPLVEAFDLYGKAKAVLWVCELAQHAGALSCDGGGHECKPDTRALLGDLVHGDHFIRRGAVMRITDTLSGDVHAVVVEGPMKGREGVLPDNHETVERTHCRHEYSPATDSVTGGIFFACNHCGEDDPTKEQETKECTNDRTPQQRPGSSAASTRTTPAPGPGSPQGTKASVPAVSPKSESVTSSAPTAKAAGNGRSAVVTTDQASAAAAFLGSGRPAATQATGAPNQADAAAQFLAGGSGAHGEKETKRDRYGRYLIPHPDTGKEKAWTRSTTFAKSISDTYALSQWGLRMALLGATKRPDVVQRAHGKHVRADKQLLDELTAELKNAAGDKVAANLGTSMHSFTEMADRAWHSPGGPRSILGQVPPDCQDMVETYIRLLEETGLEPVPNLIEFTTVVKQYGVAGTSDNCYKVTKPLMLKIGRAEVRFNPGDYVIGDKKTGRDLDYGWQEIAIQLGTYAQGINTAGVWDRQNEVWIPDPLNGANVRTDAGIVIHLPVDKESEKTPTVYGIDLESGWNAAVLCERVRAWRNARNLASPVMVSEAETFAPARPEPAVTSRTTVRPASLKDRANAVTSKGEASAVWQAAKTDGLPDSEVDELVALMQARLKKLAEPGG